MAARDATPGHDLTVSVVVPTFRRPELLALTLASLKAQTHTNFQALICDNAAQAATEKVVADLADDRFTYLARETNLGMHRNAIDGFRRADGDLVFKLDDDDILDPTCFETLRQPFTERQDVTLTFSGTRLIDLHGDVLVPQTQAWAETTGVAGLGQGYVKPFTTLAARGSIQLCAALVKRSAVDWDVFPEQTATAYDLHISLQAARDEAAAWYTPQQLVSYRMHPGSDSANKLAAQLTGGAFTLQHALDSGRYEDTAAIEAALWEHQLRRGREFLRDGQADQARIALRKAWSLRRERQSGVLLGLSYLPNGPRHRVLAARKARYVDPTRVNAH
ncbi:MAG: hypothetical protein CSA58_09095 [Micrococcales bacterium]|nr:MAG: hypothetical protein CSB46_02300 [Micrococcales bacterium]PIE26511.1 MAG: hypothetical protein CSA58_09095 [Micrococcales bacterium]